MSGEDEANGQTAKEEGAQKWSSEVREREREKKKKERREEEKNKRKKGKAERPICMTRGGT